MRSHRHGADHGSDPHLEDEVDDDHLPAVGRRDRVSGRDRRGVRIPPGRRTLTQRLRPASKIAEDGTRGVPVEFPHKAAIEASFGRPIGASAYLDDRSAAAATELGTEAFAHGDRVGFKAAPSLFVAAHEAAHTLQTTDGVRGMSSGGDAYEAHANLAAARVVAGASAADLFAHRGPTEHAVRNFSLPSRDDVIDVVMHANLVEVVQRVKQLVNELGEIAKFDVARGTFEGDLSLGNAAEIIRQLTPGGSVTGFDKLDGGSVVHLKLDVYRQTFELTGKRLRLLPGTIGLVSGDVAIADVALRAQLPKVTLHIGELVALGGTVVRDSDNVQIDAIYVRDLRSTVQGSLFSLGAGTTFREARLHGVHVPGAPTVDLDVQDMGVGVEALWHAVAERARAGLPKSGGGAAPRPPQVLPPGARIQVAVTGARLGAQERTPSEHDVIALLDGMRVAAVDRDGKELASIAISGVATRLPVPGAVQGVDIQRVRVTGSPALVPALLDGDSPLIPHQAKIAFEKLRAHFTAMAADNRPMVDLTLGPIHLDLVGALENGEPDALRIDDLDLVVRDGSARVVVKGRNLTAHARTKTGAVPSLELQLFDGDTGVAKVTVENLTGGRAGGELGAVTITGNSARVPHLLRTIGKENPALPKTVRAALARLAAQVPGAQVAIGTRDARAHLGGASTAIELSRSLRATIAVPKVGRLDITVDGARVADDDAHTAGGFDRFEATLTSITGDRVATVRASGARVDRRPGTEKKPAVMHGEIAKMSADGDTRTIADLLDALGRHVPQLPDQIRDATELVLSHRVSLGAGFHVDASLSAGAVGGQVDARAAIAARLVLAKQRGVAVIAMIGGRHEAGEYRFDAIEISLEGKPARLAVRGGRIGATAHADAIEATIGSDALMPVLEPAMLALVPAEIAAALEPLRWQITDFVATNVDARRAKDGSIAGGADDLRFRAGFAVETADGTRYECADASIVVHGPTGGHDADASTISATGGLEISGTFAIAPKAGAGYTGDAAITTGPAVLVASGGETRVTAAPITLALHAAQGREAPKPSSETTITDTERTVAEAKRHLGELRSFDLEVTVPVKRSVSVVPANTRLTVGIHTTGGTLASASVRVDPPLRALGMEARGVALANGRIDVDVSPFAKVLVDAVLAPLHGALNVIGFQGELAKLLDLAGGLVAEHLRAATDADQDWADAPADPARRPRDPDDGWADDPVPPAKATAKPAPEPFDFGGTFDLARMTGTLDASIATTAPVATATRLHGAIHGTAIDLAIPETTATRDRDATTIGPTSGTVAIDAGPAKKLDVTGFTIRSLAWTRRSAPP